MIFCYQAWEVRNFYKERKGANEKLLAFPSQGSSRPGTNLDEGLRSWRQYLSG